MKKPVVEIQKVYKKNRTIEQLGILIILIFIALTSIFLYWTTAEYKALDIKVQPVPILKGHDKVRAGDFTFLVFDFCKNVDTVGQVEVSLVSSRSAVLLPPYDDTLKKTCSKKLIAPVIIPPQAAPDMYRFHYHVVYPVNPLKTVVVEFESGVITVL